MGVRRFSLLTAAWLCAATGVLSLSSASAPAAGGGPGLIDGRGWELVSPADKHGAGIEARRQGLSQASDDGNAIAYLGNAPIVANPGGNAGSTQILSRRGLAGWSTQELSTPREQVIHPGGQSSDYLSFSPDLSVGLLAPLGETPLPPLQAGAEKTLYLRDGATGSYLPLVTAANVPPGTKLGGEFNGVPPVRFVGASPDLSHVVISDEEALTENTVNNGQANLYEWAEGRLQLVSLLPRNSEGNEESAAKEGYTSVLGSTREEIVRHAVSDDGSRIVWATSNGSSHLYLRDTVRGEAIQLDSVQNGTGSGEAHFIFQTASSDGSRVFFTDTQALTANANPGNRAEGDLYVFEVSGGPGPLSGTLHDLTVDANAGETTEVLGAIPGASEDGSYVYFIANGALTTGAVHGDCHVGNASTASFSQSCNLYVEHYSGTAWEAPKLVAILSGEDFPDGANGFPSPAGQLTVRVSPDGRYLTFISNRSLTGYDNRDAVSGEPDEEVFLYDASAGPGGRVVCVSCDPTGIRPVGIFDTGHLLFDSTEALGQLWVTASLPSWTLILGTATLYQSRFLSDNGRVFFQSVGGLVPGDVNGKSDVYEFEPVGVGGCQTGTQGLRVVFSQAAGGCVGLVSSGTSADESLFVDASAKGAPNAQGAEGGGDVFFATSDGLVPQDVDGAFDMYDAHECTSASPCVTSAAVSSPPCAAAEACRGALSSPAVFGVPGSATFTGAGNAPPAGPGPALVVKPKSKPKSLTRAQKLARALKTCRKRPRGKRANCQKRARKAYGAKTSKAVKATARSGR